jgi:hypothetical protein
MSVTLSLFAGVGAQFFDNNGNVLSGGKIYTYQAGTTTPLATYTTNSESAFHTNPIILDSAGRVPSGGEIWLNVGQGYKFVLRTSTDVLIATYDNIPSSVQPPAANDADSIMYEQGYTVTAGSFVAGKIYRIASVGTTNFTLIGAVNNTVGTHFIATGAGTGTGTAELSQTVETKLRETVSVKDFGAVGDGVTDDILAIEAALAASSNIYFPTGVYGISRPIVIQKEKVNLRGPGGYGPYGPGTIIGGAGLAAIKVLAGFTGITLGGSSGSAAIWYQAPGTWTEDNWIEGGCFENLTIDCGNRGVEGIRFNRITLGQVFRNLRIVQPTIGIFGTKWGWLTEFDNVYVNEASVTGIRLNNGYNGCTFINCALYGGNISTPVLLDIALDCYGNSFTGGFIEGGDVAVRLTNAQIAFNGTDFEVHTQKFFEIKGLYSGSPPTLQAANPPVTITGCTFVGLPSVAGIEVQGGSAEVHGNFFINSGSAPPAGVYCMEGIAGGDQTVSGFEQLCISESDNTARGWNGQLTTGLVFSRITSIAAGTTSVSKLQSGDTTSRLPENTPYNANLTGKSKAMQVFGYTLPTTATFVEGWSARHLGDVATGTTDGQNGYVANYYEVDSAAVKLEASNQGGSPVTTYGRAGLYASITQYQTTVSEYGALIDTINTGFRPLTDNSHKLGAASFRWSEVFAANGTINTSDAREKQQVRDLSAAELATAQQLKGKIKAFKWNEAVERKGDAARIHFGAMAQDVAAVFQDNGLDPEHYGIFCRDVYYTLDGETVIEGTKNAERHERLGLRYEQLLAFIIAAI